MLMALYWPRPKTGARPQITFGLSAVGNLIDRVVFGHVIDFIDVLSLFIFNVADMAILMELIGSAWDVPNVKAGSSQSSRVVIARSEGRKSAEQLGHSPLWPCKHARR